MIEIAKKPISRYVKERQKKIMIKARNSRDLPVTDNPFHNMET